ILWEFANEKKQKNDTYIISPITYRDQLITSFSENGKFELVDLTSYSRSFLLLKNGSKKTANIVTYIADKKYFSDNDQRIEGKTFSGKILVKEWNEKLL